ncbi:hypothetical protein BDV40DRAFT_284438 [Aspergillus tamarii]|uniref:C2H2-type domain-containing protein n=1 Tax=Aspergillus tamarii TaxID=41984 RepID=A0A5N6VDN8_ASPTM|nr:hypothetical protein BDV40DRAFT_284438 [Aspergillus tamarii]
MIVQVILFADAERGPNDLVITFLRGHFHDRLTWTEFKSLGPPAIAAVVQAGWRCVALEQIAESIRARRFDEKELDKLRNEARDERKRISIRKPSDPVKAHIDRPLVFFESNMASLQRQHDTLRKIVEQTSTKFICPQCLRGFPRPDVLYCHFRRQEDDIHQGLDMRNTDHKTFLLCYHKALKASIPAEQLPQGSQCFELAYIVEHYGEDVETHQHLIPNSDTHNQTASE